jgi:hemerythrin-like domain-containing protein
METNNPTTILEAEHIVILKVIDFVKISSKQMGNGKQVSVDILNKIVDFMRNYADHCHHGKEEAILFPFLIERGVPSEGCPIGALTHEHEAGRKVVSALAENIPPYQNGDDKGRLKIIDALDHILNLYPNHIWKEDFLVFPMTHKVCSDGDLDVLYRRFIDADNNFGFKVIKEYESFAENLKG